MSREEETLRENLGEKWAGLALRVLGETDSTNLRIKEEARAGLAAAPYLLMADSQTAGRGRLGRGFVSPPGTGLYMSLLFAPPPGTDSGKVTMLAAVAVCRAIEEMTDLRPKIKWVNDLFVKGKKVCGILAEGISQGVIVGIGVNVLTPPGGFPPEAGAAGALERPVDRAALAGRIARHFLDGAEDFSSPDILEAYRARMPLVGQTIQFTWQGQQKNARVTGVREDGGLMVTTPEGMLTLRSGEISLGSEAFSGLL